MPKAKHNSAVTASVPALITAASTNVLGDALQLAFAIALAILGIIVAIQGIHKLVAKNQEAQAA